MDLLIIGALGVKMTSFLLADGSLLVIQEGAKYIVVSKHQNRQGGDADRELFRLEEYIKDIKIAIESLRHLEGRGTNG